MRSFDRKAIYTLMTGICRSCQRGVVVESCNVVLQTHSKSHFSGKYAAFELNASRFLDVLFSGISPEMRCKILKSSKKLKNSEVARCIGHTLKPKDRKTVRRMKENIYGNSGLLVICSLHFLLFEGPVFFYDSNGKKDDLEAIINTFRYLFKNYGLKHIGNYSFQRELFFSDKNVKIINPVSIRDSRKEFRGNKMEIMNFEKLLDPMEPEEYVINGYMNGIIISEKSRELIDYQNESKDQFKKHLFPKRRPITVKRIVRNNKMTKKVKKLYDCRCQFCEEKLETPTGPYAVGAHIQPLGDPHKGPDVIENMLCLCGNCHILFDSGAISINDDLTIVGKQRKIKIVVGHNINMQYLKYHRDHIFKMNLLKYERFAFKEMAFFKFEYRTVWF